MGKVQYTYSSVVQLIDDYRNGGFEPFWAVPKKPKTDIKTDLETLKS